MDKDTTKGMLHSPAESPICYMRSMIMDKSISPSLMANLEQQRDKEPNAFP